MQIPAVGRPKMEVFFIFWDGGGRVSAGPASRHLRGLHFYIVVIISRHRRRRVIYQSLCHVSRLQD